MITTRTADKLERVAIFGLGRSGIAAALLALECGVEVVAFDDSGTCPNALPTECWQDPALWDLGTIDALILSPGIPHLAIQSHMLLQKQLIKQSCQLSRT